MRNICLIGPIGAGKTTLARLVGELLGKRYFDLDSFRNQYYPSYGFDRAKNESLANANTKSWYEYQKPFELRLVQDVLGRESDAVIAFGAGHSVQESESDFQLLSKVMEYNFVVHLLVDDSVNTMMAELTARKSLNKNIQALNRHFVTHPSNSSLADATIYTLGKTPEQVASEIVLAYRNHVGP